MNQADQERARLIRERRRLTDAERRTWSFTVQVVVALVLFAFAPAIPRSEHLFGALRVRAGLLIIAPGSLAAVIASIVFRRFGSDAWPHRIAEMADSLLLYSINVAVVFETRLTWSVIWILCPFTAVFWAVTKPFETRLYAAIIFIAHTGLALAYVIRGDAARAWVALAMGAASFATFAAVAREAMGDIDLEAQRNVARTRLDERTLDAMRQRVASALHEGIGGEIAQLAAELDGSADPSVRVAVAHEPAASTIVELLDRIDDRCRRFCDGIALECVRTGHGDRLIDPERGHALVHVAQELVRNAVVHGHPASLHLELSIEGDTLTLAVEDNGVGLVRDRFTHATGGLANAAQWLGEHGGLLELCDPNDRASTRLLARLPLSKHA